MAAHVNYQGEPVPPSIAALFWEYSEGDLDLVEHRELALRRILSAGSWDDVGWLRQRLGDNAIRSWLESTAGRHLDRRSLRLWQVLLDLPVAQVDEWLRDPARRVWDARIQA